MLPLRNSPPMPLITPIHATVTGATSGFGYGISSTFNGSGLSPKGFTTGTDLAAGGAWLGVFGKNEPIAGALTYDLGAPFLVDKLYVWNFHANSASTWGVRDVTIEYSLDGADFSAIGCYVFPKAPSGGVQGAQEINVADGMARYVRIQLHSSYLGGERAGLNEVRFSGTAIPEPVSAIYGVAVLAFCLCARMKTRRA